MKQIRVRMRRVFFVAASIGLQAALWAGSATAAPMGPGGRAETAFVRTTQTSGGPSDVALVAMGAGIALVLALAAIYTLKGVRRLRHATA